MTKLMILTAVALAVAAPAVAQSKLPDIQALETRWATALNAGEVEKVAELYDADAWLVLPGAPPIKGKAAIRGALGEMAKHVTGMELHTQSVVPLGAGVVVENGVASLNADDGKPNPKMSNYQVIWKRDAKGQWRIVRDVVSPL